MKSLRACERGFTLIDLMVFVVVFTVFAGVAHGLWLHAGRSERFSAAYTQDVLDTRIALRVACDDLRRASHVDVREDGSVRVEWSTPDGGDRGAVYTVVDGCLLRLANGATARLAASVDEFSIDVRDRLATVVFRLKPRSAGVANAPRIEAHVAMRNGGRS